MLFIMFFRSIRAGLVAMWCDSCQNQTLHKSTWRGWVCTEH